jgi:hypothetical protein
VRRPTAVAAVLGALLVLLASLAAPAGAVAQPGARPAPRSVTLLLVPGLRDTDLAAGLPSLAAALPGLAAGDLSSRTAGGRTAAPDALLTLGAGDRVAWPGPAGDPQPVGPASDERVARWPEVLAAARRGVDKARPGLLADTLRAAGDCVDATGATPADRRVALLAAADGAGQVQVDGSRCSVHAVGTAALVAPGDRVAALRSVDALVAGALAAQHGAAGSGAVLVIAGLPGPVPVGTAEASLRPVVVAGVGPGSLVSASTRRAPYVQLIDLAPSVLAWRGIAVPAAMTGQPIRATGRTPTAAQLADLDLRAHRAYALAYPVAVPLVGLLVAALALLVRGPRRVRRGAAVAVGVLALAPAGSFLAGLVPWWRVPGAAGATTAYAAATLVLAGLLAGVALLATRAHRTLHSPPPDRWPIAAAALTLAVLGGDLLTGARLQLDTLFGYSPLVAGRFAGIGNLAFGLLATAGLLAAVGAIRPGAPGSRRQGLLVLLVAGGTAVVDGAPFWGSDLGGLVALAPVALGFALVAAGYRLSPRRLVVVVVAAAAVVVAAAAVDLARPAGSRTHLGRFADDVLHGRGGGLLTRKLDANLALTAHGPLQVGVVLVAVAALLAVRRAARGAPVGGVAAVGTRWLLGLQAVAVAAVLGFAINDSGIAVVATALLLAVPLTGLAAAAARRPGDTPGERLRDRAWPAAPTG